MARWYIGNFEIFSSNSEFFSSMYVSINFFNSMSIGPTIGQINKCTFSIQVVSVHFIDLAMRDIVFLAIDNILQKKLMAKLCFSYENVNGSRIPRISVAAHIILHPLIHVPTLYNSHKKNPACTCTVKS